MNKEDEFFKTFDKETDRLIEVRRKQFAEDSNKMVKDFFKPINEANKRNQAALIRAWWAAAIIQFVFGLAVLVCVFGLLYIGILLVNKL